MIISKIPLLVCNVLTLLCLGCPNRSSFYSHAVVAAALERQTQLSRFTAQDVVGQFTGQEIIVVTKYGGFTSP